MGLSLFVVLSLAVLAVGMATAPALAESVKSPLKQYNMGVPIDQIQCLSGKTLMESPSGNPVCVTGKSADRLAGIGYVEVEVSDTPPEMHMDDKVETDDGMMTGNNTNVNGIKGMDDGVMVDEDMGTNGADAGDIKVDEDTSVNSTSTNGTAMDSAGGSDGDMGDEPNVEDTESSGDVPSTNGTGVPVDDPKIINGTSNNTDTVSATNP